jgi:hypothetical protein
VRRIAIALTFLMALTAFSQESKPTGSADTSSTPKPHTELTETQRLRLENLKLKFFLAQKERDQALNNLVAEADRVRKENNLPETTTFDYDNIRFTIPSPPTPPPAPAKPEAKKK